MSNPLPPLKNVLDKSRSPYLLQHKDNPVAWQEWEDATIDRAQAEDKLIFLSVGYSACHWCHVLAKESFQNEGVAAIMNKYFINIKVDREERPDVDRVYMSYLQATQGSGGWPLSVFLTPTLEPVFAGTYFPKNRFLGLLSNVHELWEGDRERVLAHGKDVIEQLRESHRPDPVGNENEGTSGQPELDLSELALRAGKKIHVHLVQRYDPIHGGFSETGPKFPSPSQNLVFLAREAVYYNYNSDGTANGRGKKAAEMGMRLLRALWEGGQRDWIGGGLARYSVDEAFKVPHFEKMLYDQSQVALAALEFSLLPNLPTSDSRKICLDLAADILEYTARDLRSPEGGFYSAEDADSSESFDRLDLHSEGAFYVWTQKEIMDVLGLRDGQIAIRFWSVEEAGNVDSAHDIQGELVAKNTLFQSLPRAEVADEFDMTVEALEEIVSRCAAKLKAHRDKTRPRPHLDDKIVTAWNGLMISALAAGSVLLPVEKYPIASRCLDLAEGAVSFVRGNLYEESTGKLTRSWRDGKGPTGQADDYAFLIKGLLDLYEATGKESHLQLAIALQATMDDLFLDAMSGGYFASAPDPRILIRMKDSQDGAEPAASSITVHNLQKLALYDTNKTDEYNEQAMSTYRSHRETLQGAPHALATTIAGLADREQGYKEYTIPWDLSEEESRRIRSSILTQPFTPNRVIVTGQQSDFPSNGTPAPRGAPTPVIRHFANSPAQFCRIGDPNCRAPSLDPYDPVVTVAYDQTAEEDPLRQVDLYFPEKASGELVVFVHGGAWGAGDKLDHANIPILLAGTPPTSSSPSSLPIVAIPNYRRSKRPAHPERDAVHPAHMLDVARSLAALHRARFGGKVTSRLQGIKDVYLLGHSCATHILSFIASDHPLLRSNLSGAEYSDLRALMGKVRGIGWLCGIYDLGDLVDEYPDYQGFVERAFPGGAEAWKGATLTGKEFGNTTTSRNIKHVVAVSKNDELLSPRQSKAWENLLRSAGHDNVIWDEETLEGTHDDCLQNAGLGKLIRGMMND